ncbi:hypothetical protein HDV03_000403 [Kappamyces sp. JEL0829]|nr:hypothetical protein HDV03_000403 [Kappamyces sp. JEL0829]
MKLHKENQPITMMTAHDYPSGMFCEKSGMEMVLVGDSLAMVALGFDSTNPITLDEMMHHSRAVARSAKTAFRIGDMPFGTYETSSEQAITNAIRYMKEGQVEAVKLEGGKEMATTVGRITSVGVPVLGHIGLTPQRAAALSGFKAQGRTMAKAQGLVEDALALQDAGAFAVVLEAIPEVVATEITRRLSIPTIGIGSGNQCSGQVLVQLDLLGAYDKLAPKFSKIYSSVGEASVNALKEYAREVKSRSFPVSGINTYCAAPSNRRYKMLPGEEEAFKAWAARD